ncbi:MAG: rRNA (cytidine1920-2-O)/16S rRNA (cytidine1409-2-O)-methyltransferase [Actinomycetota bacterium]|nr:rRNA (cytidine1920-2-O)/16S rRNA (cytidine1409-2-O)-methyltransferase [Actinomycetota bacterium]
MARRLEGSDDATAIIREGLVQVDGAIVTNPKSMVARDARIVVKARRDLRGKVKLAAALDALAVPLVVAGRVALDVGASTGGFTQELLDRGAERVYSVDVGFGQLLGSLRQDPRVVNLEATNAADLSEALVPDTVDVVVVDVSLTPLAEIVPQVSSRVRLAADADLVALVKPMFELARGSLPTVASELAGAADRAVAAIAGAGWDVGQVFESAVRGRKGAVEFIVRATRSQPVTGPFAAQGA